MPSPESQKIRATLTREYPDPTRSLADERRDWVSACAGAELASGCAETAEVIDGIRCLWISPERVTGEVVLYAHGGGLVSGTIETHKEMCSRLALALRRHILIVDYRLLPENPYTSPRDDFVGVYRALVSNGTLLPEKSIFMGDSSGAAVVFASLANLRAEGTGLPRAAVSLSAALDASLSGDSLRTRAELDPLLSLEALCTWQKLLGDPASLCDPVLSPLFADVGGFPPTLLLVGDHELWLSDSERFHEKLLKHNCSSVLAVYPGMWHLWPMWQDLPETGKALSEIAAFLER